MQVLVQKLHMSLQVVKLVGHSILAIPSVITRIICETKRQREMKYGQAGSMLKYFQDKIAENPSFQYALQMDCEEQISNIFWADAKMVMD